MDSEPRAALCISLAVDAGRGCRKLQNSPPLEGRGRDNAGLRSPGTTLQSQLEKALPTAPPFLMSWKLPMHLEHIDLP